MNNFEKQNLTFYQIIVGVGFQNPYGFMIVGIWSQNPVTVITDKII